MHIMEGFLPAEWCAVWFIISIPIVLYGVYQIKKITDTVEKGDVLAYIENKEGQHPVYASMSGLLRGLIREGYYVTKGFKMADIDPRLDEYENCFTISDKARCIAGGVLEAIFYLRGQHDLS